jgi:hypothetical protein
LRATGVVDTGSKFAAGVVDTGGNFPPFGKILNDHHVIFGAWGKMVQEKNLKQKIL